MVNWQVTAITIYCDAVDDEVTIIVYQDWSVRCTGYQRYFQPGAGDSRRLESRGRTLGRKLACQGLGCHRVVGYCDRLKAEEAGTKAEGT